MSASNSVVAVSAGKTERKLVNHHPPALATTAGCAVWLWNSIFRRREYRVALGLSAPRAGGRLDCDERGAVVFPFFFFFFFFFSQCLSGLADSTSNVIEHPPDSSRAPARPSRVPTTLPPPIGGPVDPLVANCLMPSAPRESGFGLATDIECDVSDAGGRFKPGRVKSPRGWPLRPVTTRRRASPIPPQAAQPRHVAR